MVEAVQPFPLAKAIGFKSQYLAGFQAEKRDIEYQAIKADIQNELRDYSEKLLRDTANGYTTLTGVRTSAEITGEKMNMSCYRSGLLLTVATILTRKSIIMQ